MKRSIARLVQGGSAATVLLAALLACRGAPSNKCFAAIDYNGERYSAVGTGSNQNAARESALLGGCGWYCELKGPAVQAAYSAYRSGGGKQDLQYARITEPGLKAAMQRCQDACNAAVRGKSAPSKVECL